MTREGWRLRLLRVRNFLGVGEVGIDLALDRPLIVLVGPNGAGKSTVLTAVEWALFGEASYTPGPDAGVTGRGHDKHRVFLHRGCDECDVVLEFVCGDEALRWQRTRSRDSPRPDDDRLVATLDGQEVDPDVGQLLA